MPPRRPVASVSLDLDNLWTYLMVGGRPEWERYPSYLSTFVPRALDLLDELGLRITFFVIGRDAEREGHTGILRELARRGHEIGNHSYRHEPWLHLYPREALEAELATAEQTIEAATGRRPTGFRGPGFSWSRELLEVLEARGYQYDASTLPTFLGPVARAYYFARTGLSGGDRGQRKALFGGFRDGFRPIRPYRWRIGPGRSLLEIPVTTWPVVRAPFHLSYVLYLSRYSDTLAEGYLRAAVRSCRALGVQPSFLLHALDLIGPDEAPALGFFPGMSLPLPHKVLWFRKAMMILAGSFDLVPLGTHAAACLADPRLPTRVVPLAGPELASRGA